MQDSKEQQNAPDKLDKHWHMSTDDHEISLTEIEFSIFRIHASFTRWMDDLTACCHGTGEQICSGMDFAILNIIRMHDRPKSISDIARLLNRDDISNLQYSIRKLSKAGFIKKAGSVGSKKNTVYTVSELGVKVTDSYAKYRRELLTPLTQAISDSEERMAQVSNMLSLLSGIYNQAACVAAAHRDL